MQLAKRQFDAGARVLIVAPDPEEAGVLRDTLSGAYSCEVVPSGSAAVVAAARCPFDLVVAAFESMDIGPLELLEQLEHADPSHPVALLASTAAKGADVATPGTFRYISSAHTFGELRAVFPQTIGQRARQPGSGSSSDGEARDLESRAEHPSFARGDPSFGLIGVSRAMTALVESIERVAEARASVLIVGESGSGKDLIARAIHAHGPRRGRPLVTVNVAAIPEQLLDSEMFGHVRGAFTGASQARAGLFASAHTGTLFLDEIGDMPYPLQAKLLRVLESGELRPVGGDSARKVDVRLLAATHRDLPALIAQGRFREDLYFRLNVLPVCVPPLRERREDIADLATHFLAEARRRTPHSPVLRISDDALAVLTRAPWPGNVRELANVIERLVVMAGEEVITPSHLSFLAQGASATLVPVAAVRLLTLKQLTERHVERVLASTDGNKKRAADILGVDLSTLYRWQAEDRGAIDR